MRKLMLAGNRLTSLPEELSSCKQLELLRISANNLTELPDWLLNMPKLSWLATAGNQFTGDVHGSVPGDTAASSSCPVDWAELTIGERLGEGASGYVHKAVWTRRGAEGDQQSGGTPHSEEEKEEVAVKLFKGETTSDGLPEHEMQVRFLRAVYFVLP
jgi:serine/threonine protein kinase